MRYVSFLVLLAVMAICATAWADNQSTYTATKDVKVKIAHFVKIEFCDNTPFCLDVEVKDGMTFDCDVKTFKAIHNCPARIMGELNLPLPAGVSKSVSLDGDGNQIWISGTGVDMHSARVCVSDVDVTDLAGCYHGQLRLTIEATGCGGCGCFCW